MTTIKLKDSNRCKHKLDIHQHGILVSQVHCVRHIGHAGFHKTAQGSVWATQDKLQSIIENEGKSL